MDKNAEFIQTVNKDILSIYATIDYSYLDWKSFRSLIIQKIANLSAKYKLQSNTIVPLKNEDNSFSYIDVLWLLDSIPLAAFDVGMYFRIRSVWKLKKYHSLYKYYVFFGKLTEEQRLTLKAIDDKDEITLFEFQDFDKNELRKKKTNMKTPVKERGPKPKRDTKKTTHLTPSLLKTLSLFRKGYSISQIASNRNLAKSTISDHLVKIMDTGEYLNLDSIIPREKQEAILAAAKKLDTSRLTPIKDLLGDDYSWDEIKLVLAHNRTYDLFE